MNGRASRRTSCRAAKGIAGGFPLGAVLAKEAVGKHMVPGTHGSTFGGNPLACAAGNAALDVILAPGFLDDVDRKGAQVCAPGWRRSCGNSPRCSRTCAASACCSA